MICICCVFHRCSRPLDFFFVISVLVAAVTVVNFQILCTSACGISSINAGTESFRNCDPIISSQEEEEEEEIFITRAMKSSSSSLLLHEDDSSEALMEMNYYMVDTIRTSLNEQDDTVSMISGGCPDHRYFDNVDRATAAITKNKNYNSNATTATAAYCGGKEGLCSDDCNVNNKNNCGNFCGSCRPSSLCGSSCNADNKTLILSILSSSSMCDGGCRSCESSSLCGSYCDIGDENKCNNLSPSRRCSGGSVHAPMHPICPSSTYGIVDLVNVNYEACGGCGACEGCRACDTTGGKCGSCSTVDTCDTCDTSYGKYDACDIVDLVNNNYEACGDCGACGGCSACDTTCGNCGKYGSCSTVDTCNTCDISCGIYDACNIIDLANNNFEACGGCGACGACSACDAIPGKCDSCSTVDACNTCDTSCGTYDACNIVDLANDNFDACGGCGACGACSACDAIPGKCGSCSICDTCNTCDTSCGSNFDPCGCCGARGACSACDTSCGECGSTCEACNTCDTSCGKYGACSPCGNYSTCDASCSSTCSINNCKLSSCNGHLPAKAVAKKRTGLYTPTFRKSIFTIPNPTHVAATPILPMSQAITLSGDVPIGIAVNGVVFSNHSITKIFDSCMGHVDGNGCHRYHYHLIPTCLLEKLGQNMSDINRTYWKSDDPVENLESWPINSNPSPILGWAMDGIPIMGPYDDEGELQVGASAGTRSTLDECNGKYSPTTGLYAYYLTPNPPYNVACFRGGCGMGNYEDEAIYGNEICPSSGIDSFYCSGDDLGCIHDFEQALDMHKEECLVCTSSFFLFQSCPPLSGHRWQVYSTTFGILFLLVCTIPSLLLLFDLHYRQNRPILDNHVLVNIFSITASFSTFLVMIIDPHYTRQVLSPVLVNILYGLKYPCINSAVVLLTLSFHELIVAAKKLKRVKEFLPKSRYIFFGITIFEFGVQIMADTLRGKGYSYAFLIACQYFFITWGIILSVLLFTLAKMLQERFTPMQRKASLTFFICVYGCCVSVLAMASGSISALFLGSLDDGDGNSSYFRHMVVMRCIEIITLCFLFGSTYSGSPLVKEIVKRTSSMMRLSATQSGMFSLPGSFKGRISMKSSIVSQQSNHHFIMDDSTKERKSNSSSSGKRVSFLIPIADETKTSEALHSTSQKGDENTNNVDVLLQQVGLNTITRQAEDLVISQDLNLSVFEVETSDKINTSSPQDKNLTLLNNDITKHEFTTTSEALHLISQKGDENTNNVDVLQQVGLNTITRQVEDLVISQDLNPFVCVETTDKINQNLILLNNDIAKHEFATTSEALHSTSQKGETQATATSQDSTQKDLSSNDSEMSLSDKSTSTDIDILLTKYPRGNLFGLSDGNDVLNILESTSDH